MTSPVICIGATLVDELYYCLNKTIPSSSNPARLKKFPGGVACNIAQHLALLDIPVQLITVLGKDPDGAWLYDACKAKGIGQDITCWVDDHTGKYASVLNEDGSLFVAACTDPCNEYLTAHFLELQQSFLSTANMIMADLNLPIESIRWLAGFCEQHKIPLLIETVSVSKAKKLAGTDLRGIYMITPNEDELPSLCTREHENKAGAILELQERGVKNIWLRKGRNGSEIIGTAGTIDLKVPPIEIKDSTGAGDAALAGWVAAKYMSLNDLECIRAGHSLAMDVLQVNGAIVQNITREQLFNHIQKYYPDEK